MTLRYFSIAGIIAKDLGTGLIPSIFAIFHHRPPLYEEKICPVWVFFCGWNRGNNLSLPIHVVEPRAQQTSTGKLWRRWLPYITCTTLVLTACPCILHLSELTAVAEHHQYTALYLPFCCNGGSFFGCQTRPSQQLLKLDVISRTGISF